MQRTIGLLAVLAVLAAPVAVAAAGTGLTLERARSAAEASMRMIPGDDIMSDHRVRDVRIADLDGDDVPEIVYRYMATCVDAGLDCPNELVVMTRLAPNDGRGIDPYAHSPCCNDKDTYAAIRASGYADDVGVHIPGDVERIGISNGTISVTFLSQEDSPICLRIDPERHLPTNRCPPPGRFTWRYAWTPGRLVRIEAWN